MRHEDREHQEERRAEGVRKPPLRRGSLFAVGVAHHRRRVGDDAPQGPRTEDKPPHHLVEQFLERPDDPKEVHDAPGCQIAPRLAADRCARPRQGTGAPMRASIWSPAFSPWREIDSQAPPIRVIIPLLGAPEAKQENGEAPIAGGSWRSGQRRRRSGHESDRDSRHRLAREHRHEDERADGPPREHRRRRRRRLAGWRDYSAWRPRASASTSCRWWGP